VNSYFAAGLEGWRAHHSGVSHLASSNRRLQRTIEARVARARRILLTPVRGDANCAKRLHMNSYLQQLVRRFGDYSVEQLISVIEQRLKAAVGTVYVGDLLGIADAVVEVTGRRHKREHGKAAA
jgi:hypothetical protein